MACQKREILTSGILHFTEAILHPMAGPDLTGNTVSSKSAAPSSVSLRSKVDRIQLCTRTKDDMEKVNSIGRKLVKLRDVSETDGTPDGTPYSGPLLIVQHRSPQSSFRPTF